MIKPQLEYLYTNEDLVCNAFHDYVKATRELLDRLRRYLNKDQKELFREFIKEGTVAEFITIWLDDIYNN